ncbi:MAG TPA: MFS transporter [Candidatus Limnocylindria bacterium]|jgi:DHA3 family macrolide efflux protein-like MFS transporter|nr:MFS transporter [Candidatus Limnocylindria bacterium]
MLLSGVALGIAAGIAFGGEWRRLSTFTLYLWPVLVVGAGLRLIGYLIPASPLAVYFIGLLCIAVVAARNWRLPGAALISVGTFANVLVVLLNNGMPYDARIATEIHALPPANGLYVELASNTILPFLGDIIPVAIPIIPSVYSVGDFLIGFGGFLIPFLWLQAAPEEVALRHELRSTNFALFWLAQVISRFGDPITLIALTFVTYRLTGSAVLTALAVVITTIPNALFSLFGGAIADAVGARRAMLWCDILRVLFIGVVPLLLDSGVPLAVVFFLVFVSGICGAIFNPARVAIVPALLTPERLPAGNSLVYGSDRAVEIGGALAAGVLVATFGDGAFYADALTFALSALLLSRIVISETSRELTLPRVWRDGIEGLRFIRRTAVVWSNTIFSLAAQLALPVVNGLTPVLIIRRFADGDATTGAVLFGGAEAALAFGAVLGSALFPPYLAHFQKGHLLIAGFATWGTVAGLIAVAPNFTIALGLFALLGASNVLFFVPTVTILQEATPPDHRARVFGARIAITNLSWLPLVLISGALGDAIGVHVLIAFAGLVTVATAVTASFVPAIRDVA